MYSSLTAQRVSFSLLFVFLLCNLSDAQSDHKHSNALVKETSPYLLLHAHNPVNWYGWREETLALAKKENKPIFLSIGYTSCPVSYTHLTLPTIYSV